MRELWGRFLCRIGRHDYGVWRWFRTSHEFDTEWETHVHFCCYLRREPCRRWHCGRWPREIRRWCSPPYIPGPWRRDDGYDFSVVPPEHLEESLRLCREVGLID